MTTDSSSPEDIVALRERAKELQCLYEVVAVLARREDPPPVAFAGVLAAIPSGWQYPDDTTCRIEYFGRSYAREDFVDAPWRQRSPIAVARTTVGAIEVRYKHEHPAAFEGPFLRQERELLDRIAARLGEFLEWKHRELAGERIGAAPRHWEWRQRFAERLAARLDPVRFDVERVYLFGSTESGAAGVASDIDLLVVHRGDAHARRELEVWLEGWSLCLAETSYHLSGLPSEGLLDVHFVAPDAEHERVQALAASGTPPRELPLGGALGRPRS